MKSFKKFIRDNKAATAIEYGLIAALIAVGLITALSSLEGSLSGIFGDVGAELDGAGGGGGGDGGDGGDGT